MRNIGQLKTAFGKAAGGAVPRLNEQFGYAYDRAGNLSSRTNNALVQGFQVNSLNALTNVWRTGTLTVEGATTSAATNVTVWGTGLASGAAALYGDNTWARAGAVPANGNNTYSATAHDDSGRSDTATISAYLPRTNSYVYDLNGNLLSDGRRYFQYDDENQLSSVTVSNAWRSEFVYDGKMRRRIRREKTWSGGSWDLSAEVRYVYDGNLVLQERDGGNLPLVTYTRGKDLSGSLEGAGGIGGLLARTAHSTLNPQLSTALLPLPTATATSPLSSTPTRSSWPRTFTIPYGNILGQSGVIGRCEPVPVFEQGVSCELGAGLLPVSVL